MSKKKIIFLVIVVLAGAGAWYGYHEFNRKNKDLSDTRPDVVMTATDLIRAYEQNDSLANKNYLGRIVEVSGIVKDISKDETGYYTIVLGDTAGLSAVRCSMDTLHQADAALAAKGSSVRIRGNCTGFNRDELGLGSDVILNFGVLVKEKK